MEAFISRKRRKLAPEVAPSLKTTDEDGDGESTDFKLAILESLHPDWPRELLLDSLLACDGSVERVADALLLPTKIGATPKRPASNGFQSSLASYARPASSAPLRSPRRRKC